MGHGPRPTPGGESSVILREDRRLKQLEALTPEALLDLVDPGLQRRHVLFQLCEGALEDLAPAALVSKPRLDSAQGLRDRVVLLLESLEAVVDRIEVPEQFLSQLGDAEVYPVESAVHLGEPVADLGGRAVQGRGELLVLGRGHGPCLSQRPAVRKCLQVWTGRAIPEPGSLPLPPDAEDPQSVSEGPAWARRCRPPWSGTPPTEGGRQEDAKQ